MLFIDDLQWLDAGTLELLERLVTRARGAFTSCSSAPTATTRSVRRIRSRARSTAIRGAGGAVSEVTLAPLDGRTSGATLRRRAAHRRRARSAAGRAGVREDRRQSVLCHPVHHGAGRRGAAHVRRRARATGSGTSAASGPRASPTTWPISWPPSWAAFRPIRERRWGSSPAWATSGTIGRWRRCAARRRTRSSDAARAPWTPA